MKEDANPLNWTHAYLLNRIADSLPEERLPPTSKLLRAMFGEGVYGLQQAFVPVISTLEHPSSSWTKYIRPIQVWYSKCMSDYFATETRDFPFDACMSSLSIREKKVLDLRLGFVDGRSRALEDVSKEFNVTRERVRQIEAKALRKLRRLCVVKHLGDIYKRNIEQARKGLLDAIKGRYPELTNTSLESLEQKSPYREAPSKFLIHPVGDDDAQWLCGFWEGDGSMSTQGNIQFVQKDRRILVHVKELLGTHRSIRYPTPDSVNVCSQISLEKEESYHLLKNYFAKYLISDGRKEQISKYANLQCELHKPTIPWIVGFWDAEGCFFLQGRALGASVSQKDVRVLEKVQKVIGGKISGMVLSLRKKEIETFLPLYKEYSHNPQKLERLEEFQLVTQFLSWQIENPDKAHEGFLQEKGLLQL